MKMADPIFTQTLVLLRSTKSTHVYVNLPGEDASAFITQLHIRQSAFKGAPPKQITMSPVAVAEVGKLVEG
jgi:hypothetical protein